MENNLKVVKLRKIIIQQWSKGVLILVLIMVSTPFIKNAITYFTKADSVDNTISYNLKIEEIQKRLEQRIRALSIDWKNNSSEEVIANKKAQLSNVAAISFHFANKEQINNFYNDYFKEPTIEKIVSETARELSGNIKGTLPEVLKATAGGKDIKKWISTIKLPDISVNEMFRRYQKQTIINSQVTIGLEVLDVDLTKLERFIETVEKLKKDFEFGVEEKLVEKKKVSLKEQAAEKTLSRLEEATGWVLIDGKFKIEDFSGDFYKLVYFHPVNDYLPKEVQPIMITCIVKKSAISSHFSGNYAQSIGQVIPLKIYGKIWQPLNRNTNNMEVQVTPLAIY